MGATDNFERKKAKSSWNCGKAGKHNPPAKETFTTDEYQPSFESEDDYIITYENTPIVNMPHKNVVPVRDVEFKKLQQQIKELRREVRTWKARSNVSFDRWWKRYERDYSDPTIQEILNGIKEEWDKLLGIKDEKR